ncbi:hypothetical protein CALCODRAFT_478409 [Calocera cornea HHB12733]|uniref:Uncharacterized protein n=1 Tax=Calocera cornea HHB12733 TaxID=1353952 RepID=A0A165C8W2_9BASI|nr:hypothetical protein CALCODRAFT_478409 [Calocera cornea HHB12733]
MPPRSVYLIVYHSPLFPAHWALYIPNLPPNEEREPNQVGRVLNVVGSSFSGFRHEFKRNYDLVADGRSYSLFLLDGEVDSALVGEPGERESIDGEAMDALEGLALTVPAPGPSLLSADTQGRRGRAEIRNCQTWLREAVEAYVKAGMLHAIALERLATAPMN